MRDPTQARIALAIGRLKSLYDSEAGFAELIAFGSASIPALRAVLFEREPSGLFHGRQLAAEALAALKAFDVLAEFLRCDRAVWDPVERLGEDAVVSTAARVIAQHHEDWVYELLAKLASRRRLIGVLVGLGSFLRSESIPVFITALFEDDVRLTAEAVLRQFGKAARPALIVAALDRGDGSESQLRKRRSALGLLFSAGLSQRDWPRLRELLDDEDHELALLACKACMTVGSEKERKRVPVRLTSLTATADWLEKERIDDLLKALQSHSSSNDRS